MISFMFETYAFAFYLLNRIETQTTSIIEVGAAGMVMWIKLILWSPLF